MTIFAKAILSHCCMGSTSSQHFQEVPCFTKNQIQYCVLYGLRRKIYLPELKVKAVNAGQGCSKQTKYSVMPVTIKYIKFTKICIPC